MDCPDDAFLCRITGECLPIDFVKMCDGIAQCSDGSDEMGCSLPNDIQNGMTPRDMDVATTIVIPTILACVVLVVGMLIGIHKCRQWEADRIGEMRRTRRIVQRLTARLREKNFNTLQKARRLRKRQTTLLVGVGEAGTPSCGGGDEPTANTALIAICNHGHSGCSTRAPPRYDSEPPFLCTSSPPPSYEDAVLDSLYMELIHPCRRSSSRVEIHSHCIMDKIDSWNYPSVEEDPGQLPFQLPVIFTVLLALIFVLGVTGNLLTLITVIRTPCLRSTTNLFLCNLAISDTLLLVFGGAPFDIILLWHDNRSPTAAAVGFCEIRTLLAETASSVSVATIVIVTCERYLAICQPFSSRRYYQDSRRLWVGIAAAWLFSLIPSSVITYQYGYREPVTLDSFVLGNFTFSPTGAKQQLGYGYCDVIRLLPYIYEITFVTLFIFPMIMIAFAYTAIVRRIQRSLSCQPGACSDLNSENEHAKMVFNPPHIRARYLVIKMLIVVVTIFFFTHLPMHIQRLLYLHTPKEKMMEKETVVFLLLWYNIAGVLQFGGAACNPIMYTAMSMRFRAAFQRFIGVNREKAAGGKEDARLVDRLLKPPNVKTGSRRRSMSHSPFVF